MRHARRRKDKSAGSTQPQWFAQQLVDHHGATQYLRRGAQIECDGGSGREFTPRDGPGGWRGDLRGGVHFGGRGRARTGERAKRNVNGSW